MRANGAPGRRFLTATTVLLVALTAAGCSGDDGGSEPEAAPSQSFREPGEAPTLQVKPVTTSGQVVGRLPRKDRRRVQQRVSRVALSWVEDAYLGGRYPRRAFRNSFAVFTPRARAAARRDLARTTNARIGARVDEVTPTRVAIRVDLLAFRRRAVTGTAHVDVRFRTSGRLDGRFRVAGRLMMTRDRGRWRVFGYDLARGRVDAARAGRRDRQDDRGGRA